MSPGIRIGRTSIGSNKSVQPYWNPLIPLGGETPSFWYKEGTRNELVLPNSVSSGTNDASIVLPHLNTYLATNGHAYINDNGSMDIINNLGKNPLAAAPDDLGYTVCGTLNSESVSKAAYQGLLGKLISGSAIGRFGIGATDTDGYLYCTLQSSGGTITITSTIDYTSQTFPFVLMDVNYTTKIVRFFIKLSGGNLTQIGVDTAFTGTLSQLGNNYRFYLGAYNTTTTGVATLISKSSFVNIKTFNKILTPAQMAQEASTYDVSGAVNFYPCNDIYLSDCGTGGKHLTSAVLDRTNIEYDAYGSKHLLNIGYSKYTKYPDRDVHVGYKQDGTVLNYTPSGYTKESDNTGSLINHNGADSYLIPTTGTVDRSDINVTKYLGTISTYQYYYNATYKTGVNSIEFTNYRIRNYYKSINHFSKRIGQLIADWVIYPTGKTGNDYTKAITWGGENTNPVFGSGKYLSMGMDSAFDENALHLYLGRSLSATEEFMPYASIVYTGAPTPQIGNTKVLPLNVNKCNGTTPVIEGEINWILTHEAVNHGSMYLAKSYNGVDWEFILQLPDTTPASVGGQCDFFIDNNDPSDFNNIHVITFDPPGGKYYETHPLNAAFTQWSPLVLIFDVSLVVAYAYNCTILLISGTYHMFYSTLEGGGHYMYHAICTYDPFLAVNDWHNTQTGNWSGLGSIESFSFVNTGGSNWILYYLDITAGKYKYSLSTDDCATWSAGTIITSLSTPLQFSVGVIRLV